MISFDWNAVLYLATSSSLGAISALASVLGYEGKELTCRVIWAYMIAGGLVSLGLTLFLVAEYGFSYFLLGVSVFAGYKAFDTLAIVSKMLGNIVKKFIEK